MSRKKRTGEDGPTPSEGDSTADVPAQGNGPLARADELQKWMAGESSILAWLEEEPSAQPTFYTDPAEIIALDPELKEKVARYEEELAVLRGKVANGDRNGTTGPEAAQLRAEVERLARVNGELRDRMSEITPESMKALESIIRQRELALEAREKALNGNGGGEMSERYRAELEEKATEARAREAELISRIDMLERDLKTREIEIKLREDELKLAKMSKPEANKEIEEKIRGVQEREKRILELQDTIGRFKDMLTEREDELKGLKEIVAFKEQEFNRREEDLVFRERKVTEEKRRLEDDKRQTVGLEEAEIKKRLEELKAEVDKRERELKAKEDYLRSKEADLRKREQGAIEEELKNKDQEIAVEVDAAKAKTGNPRLDDLLMGGIPFGSNVLVYGPPFIGKETMVNQFIAEGLKKGIPAIWVSTDKMTKDLREEMKLVLPSYEEYEALGLVRYVDSYSRSMGDQTEDPYTTYIDLPTAHDRIMEAVEEIAKVFKEKHEYYRLAFRTISTLIAYSDPNTAFRFLTPFCGRRKRDRAVTMYTIEKGMHGEQEIQMVGSIMDGMIDFKVDQLRTFFMVRGITDVQSRSYVRYNATRHGLSIGSFALDHIK